MVIENAHESRNVSGGKFLNFMSRLNIGLRKVYTFT